MTSQLLRTLTSITLGLGAAAAAAGEAPLLPPELQGTLATSDYGMVATGSPEATMAAVEILERGGNAVDAAVAAALALSVADADASGLGGATVALVHLAHGPTVAIDGSSRTPSLMEVEKLREMDAAGRNYGYETVAVPGTPAALEHLRSRFGTMSFAELVAPAIRLAERGYALSPTQLMWTEDYYDDIIAASIYMPFLAMEDGRTIGRVGDRQCQPELAATLRRLAREGVDSFYRGPIADAIEADMAANGGCLRKADLVMYRVQEIAPLRTSYRGREVLSFPPPGGGGALIAMLRILESYPSAFLAEDSADRHHVVVEAARIAHADKFNAGDGAAIPGLGRARAQAGDRERQPARAIVPGRAIPQAELTPSVPVHCMKRSGESTTQISVVDQDGNVVSLTQTLSRSYGAKVATPGLGFPYNSFLETFNVADPGCPGFIAPRVPCNHDMAPTIVLEDGRLLGAIGTPGSARIPSILAAVISNLVDRDLGLLEAVTAPRAVWGGSARLRACLEVTGPITAEQVEALAAFGHAQMTATSYPAGARDMANFGGVNAVAFDPRTGTFIGVVDPRRGGLAEGPQVVVAHD